MGIWFHVILDVVLCQCIFRILIKLPSAFQKETPTLANLWTLFLANFATDPIGDWRVVPALASGAMSSCYCSGSHFQRC